MDSIFFLTLLEWRLLYCDGLLEETVIMSWSFCYTLIKSNLVFILRHFKVLDSPCVHLFLQKNCPLIVNIFLKFLTASVFQFDLLLHLLDLLNQFLVQFLLCQVYIRVVYSTRRNMDPVILLCGTSHSSFVIYVCSIPHWIRHWSSLCCRFDQFRKALLLDMHWSWIRNYFHLLGWIHTRGYSERILNLLLLNFDCLPRLLDWKSLWFEEHARTTGLRTLYTVSN